MRLASGGLGRTLRLPAAALLGAATVTACGSAAHPSHPAQSATSSPSGSAVTQASPTPAALPGGGIIPDQISIPAIKVDTTVVPVGETATGNLQSPPNWNTVGWFSQGFRPGAPGHAVLNGHLDTNMPEAPIAVFWNLNKLRAGDAIILTGTDGTVLNYTVSALNVYPVNGAPLAQIYGPSQTSMLELVTCTGVWRGSALGYSERLVVSATLDPGQA